MKKTLNKLPATLALQRCVVVSDGLFFNKTEDESLSPLYVFEHGVRGTQNVNTSTGSEKDIANVQFTESAKTDPTATSFVIRFDIRSSSLYDAIVMCSEPSGGKAGKEQSKSMRENIDYFIHQAIKSGAHLQLAMRYARNIMNGRWLWRNRVYGQKITVIVREADGNSDKFLEADALATPMNNFNNATSSETEIAQLIAKGWEGDLTSPALRIEAHVDFGIEGSFEVYPSQNYVEKERGFARSLYKLPIDAPHNSTGVAGQAALRDQKINNALRTIDTWYKGFEDLGLVTPVEPLGANLALAEFLRTRQESAFELLKDIGNIDPTSDDGQFLLATLVRGGVFGEKAKKDNKEKKDGGDVTAEV